MHSVGMSTEIEGQSAGGRPAWGDPTGQRQGGGGIYGTLAGMTADSELSGRLLEALMADGGASESLPNPSDLDRDSLHALASELLQRGWIDAGTKPRADGKLYVIRNVRITMAGERALADLRAISGRSVEGQSMTQSSRSLEEKRTRRLLFMQRLYELTDGSKLARANMWELGQGFGWDRAEVQNVVEYLKGEGLLDFAAMGGVINITHLGVLEVEQAMSEPDAPTEHFPPSVNLIHVEQMIGSQIQQGTKGSVQEGNFLSDGARDSVRDLVQSLRSDLTDIVLEDEVDQSELEAELATAEQQIKSRRPKRSTIRTSLEAIEGLLAKATVVTGSTVQLAAHLETLHVILPGI